jgi:two-component system LytT family sensor kinase
MELSQEQRKILIGRTAIHIYFWIFIACFIFAASMMAGATYQFAGGLSVGLVVFCSVPVCLHFYILERYFNRSNYISYIVSLLAIVFVSAFICYYFFSHVFGVKNNYLQWTVDIIFVLVITTAIKFVRNGFNQKLLLQEAKNKQLEAELNFLKSQINPHFLFNTLNNLYALSLENSGKVPDVILKLSDLMRYILQSSEDRKVKLEDECKFLQDYIELEKLRLHNNKQVILDIGGELKGKKIAPMLLIPFAENSFKHGGENGAGLFFIKIELIITQTSKLFYRIENSRDKSAPSYNQKTKPGMGLHNIKRRLELLYPHSHQLVISESEDRYKIELDLQL